MLFDDKAIIVYNSEPDSPVELNKDDYKKLLDKAKGTENASFANKNSLESLSGFERVAVGGAYLI